MGLRDDLLLSHDDRNKVYESMTEKIEKGNDFYAMVVLSGIICTFGLISNNAAVIIGAMLIAPLMYPILSISIAMLFGDMKLLRKGLYIEFKAIILVIILSTFIVLFIPGAQITAEVLIRTSPTLVDLGIAIASGLAGTYAICRRMDTTLPGVAIAVALLPPVCSIGIGIAFRRVDVFFGALLLFLANIIAINLASFITFWFFKIMPGSIQRENVKSQVIKRLKISVTLLMIVIIPLAVIMFSSVSATSLENKIEETIENKIFFDSELIFFDYKKGVDGWDITATINSPKEYDSAVVADIRDTLQAKLGKKVNLDFRIVLVDRYEFN